MKTEEHGNQHWYLVSYDIRHPKRWRQAYRLLRGTGERIQYSLFRCRLTRTALEALRWELEQILDREDDLLVVHLCPRCAGGVEARGKAEHWDEPSARFAVL
ncbi:MAG: CRISPR-associated endonuclease Cas2 [Candidatus Accumulibacter sp.]|uniref:CRISPR-associated endonuclease Cas2 n=1 Tax=Accumulibacter sp. TaxID=2053492 RepID=UPI001A63D5F3|nr:CRISPR-associated endonuclease Cas2 [Accumulibacter sp.]MBL8393150.1 CRISPR-associated endonuclease Cas2 [Accumulibacter sp.]